MNTLKLKCPICKEFNHFNSKLPLPNANESFLCMNCGGMLTVIKTGDGLSVIETPHAVAKKWNNSVLGQAIKFVQKQKRNRLP